MSLSLFNPAQSHLITRTAQIKYMLIEPATIIVIFIVIVVIYLFSSLRLVPSGKRAVVFRLGRFLNVKGPGLIIRIPVLDMLVIVPIKSTPISFKHIRGTTKDIQTINITPVISLHMIDAKQAVLTLNYEEEINNVLKEFLRNKLESIPSTDLLAQRSTIESDVREQIIKKINTGFISIDKVELEFSNVM